MAALLIAGLIALISYATFGGPRYRVNLCMEYGGRSSCRTVSAKSETAAIRSATENACAEIASGVSDTMRCEQAEPKSVRWLGRPK